MLYRVSTMNGFFDKSQLEALRKRLETDLAAVNYALSQVDNEALGRVSELLERPTKSPLPQNNGHITSREVRETILAMPGEFSVWEVKEKLNEKFPGRSIPKGSISTLMFRLKQDKKLKPLGTEDYPPKYVVA